MNIDITKLTPAQLAEVQKQLAAQRAADKPQREKRYAIIDKMLQEKDGDAFKHTTADILGALQTAKLVSADLNKHDRGEWLKKIQTRKQHLEKLVHADGPNKGQLVYAKGTLGYKPSAGGIGALTADRVIDWLIEHSAELSKADKDGIIKALKS